MSEFSVAIIGAGASGVLTAAHLHRRDPAHKIALIDQGNLGGRGLAYGTSYQTHLLNVRAARMSAFADEEKHFTEWLKRREPASSPEDFAPRRWYGDYLSEVLAQTCAKPSGTSLIKGTAVAVEREKNGDWTVKLREGESIRASAVVLALGNLPPGNPFGGKTEMPKDYWPDPWANGAARGVPEDSSVLIIGTGLTMLDLVLSLRREGHRGVIHAISRRGLLPQAHLAHPAFNLDPPMLPVSPNALLRWLRRQTDEANRAGKDWRCVIDGMRSHTAAIWQGWTLAQRRSFLRHARPYWDTHRHRCAPEIAAQIAALIESKNLVIHCGRLQSIHETSEGLEVQWLGLERDPKKITVARVLNCTGPASNYAKLDLPLVAQMREAGWLTPDPLGLGVETDNEGRLIDTNGNVIAGLFAIGSLRRPSWWESIAIPEIRIQADALAKLVTRSSGFGKVQESRAEADGPSSPCFA